MFLCISEMKQQMLLHKDFNRRAIAQLNDVQTLLWSRETSTRNGVVCYWCCVCHTICWMDSICLAIEKVCILARAIVGEVPCTYNYIVVGADSLFQIHSDSNRAVCTHIEWQLIDVVASVVEGYRCACAIRNNNAIDSSCADIARNFFAILQAAF